MLRTALCDLLGIKVPLLQGGMAWIADASLAAAVSNAGGLGVIASMHAGADWLRAEIAKLRRLTDRPFGVNIMLMSPLADEIAQIVLEERVKIVITGAGVPTKHIRGWVEAGITVIPVVPSTGIARYVARRGAAAVIAEGGEAGGHVGELGTMVLTPQVADAVDIPVVAAGGIADGRGVAAAFMLGASGVQMGTRFLAAEECHVHPNYKRRVLKAQDIDTITTGRRLGHPVRSLKTPMSMEYARLEYDMSVSNEELVARGTGALRLAVEEGDERRGCFMAGQCASLVKREQPVAEIIREVFAEAEACLKEAAGWMA